MSGASGGPPGGRPTALRLVSLRSLTTRSSAFPAIGQGAASPRIGAVDLINNLRSMASSDAIVPSQAAEVICELSRHDVMSNTRRLDVSNNFKQIVTHVCYPARISF
jgi:hypothetical protein